MHRFCFLPKNCTNRLHLSLIVVAVAVFAVVTATANTRLAAQELKFKIVGLTIDANEGIASADVDQDGKVDLVSGRFWYANDDWRPRPLRNINDWNGYVESNGDYIFDVNRDGLPDVVAGSFLPTEIHWYENPGKKALQLGQQWKQHLLKDSKQSHNEGGLLIDLDGDKIPELVIDRWKKDTPFLVQRFVESKVESNADNQLLPFTLETVEIGPSGNGHGLAVGDISGDGKLDILVGQGWYEQPMDNPWSKHWRFHADWDLHASLPMLIVDLDEDGRNDLIFGNGHDYGLYWWKNISSDDSGTITWEEYTIDDRYSQPHSLAWADLTGDGKPELITGKRYYAHNGNDPGGKEMPCLYYYTWNNEKQSFTRYTIDEGHVGTGLQIVTEDFNLDGRIDLAVAGKSGTYVLYNLGE